MHSPDVPLQFSPTDDMLIVFQLPNMLPGGFLFSGATPVEFAMTDWFQATKPDGSIATDAEITDEVKSKRYYIRQSNYLILRRSGAVFLIPAELKS